MVSELGQEHYIFLAPANISMLPYVQLYENKFRDNGRTLKIIYWLRYPELGKDDVEQGSSRVSYKRKCNRSENILQKSLKYLLFVFFLYRLLRKENGAIIIVNTLQLSLCLYPLLLFNFKSKYIIDIRDYPKYFIYFKYIYYKIVVGAKKVIISSRGFQLWLPDRDYTYVPNVSYHALNSIKNIKIEISNRADFPFVILTLGQIRCFEIQCKIVSALTKDGNVVLQYYGVGEVYSMLKRKYSDTNNVFFGGGYEKINENDIVLGSDFVSILSDNNDLELTLESNRMLLAVILGKPVIVFKGSHQTTIVEKYDLGVVVSRVEEIEAKIQEFIGSNGFKKFSEGRIRYLSMIYNELNSFNNCEM